ncbi:hypothetical protein EQW78_12205 [Oerskovia turbata]|uniref:Uncharacterized protein n=1 Tax=Oerskovia turbata TaxID=1713 RepID=A0A4Q1KSZ0_9CELL|nr:hypothetical protein [Oerskovia turbata]RXR25671.1 hypothetical protein EQW73_09140 [Oerskovia turbata]RXR33241.1 hypothetical protein EQW78_12205 [Oerskovia turbata]TGJ96311.1 hypothetical protein DLJ96_11300 [Actinotalea fermentans ATCC 43279 = JCM 9966 = DSM 3133]
MSYYTTRRPDAGDLTVLTSLSAGFGAHADQARAAAGTLASASGDLGVEAWQGVSGDAWRAQVPVPEARLARVQAAAEAFSRAVGTYVTVVAWIASDATVQRTRLDEAEHVIARLYWDSEYTGSAICYDEDDRDRARRRVREQAEQDVLDAWAALRALEEQRAAADSTFCAALAADAPDGWSATYRALLAGGIDSTAEMSSTELAAAFAGLADRVASGDASERELERLQAFFDTWGGSNDVMAQYFLKVGGETTVAMVDRLGDDAQAGRVDPAAALLLAAGIRAALSTGSARWSPRTADRFAEQMLSTASATGGGGVAAIGFLFSNPLRAPLGETLAVAVADALDDQERNPLNASTGAWYDTSPNAGGRFLAGLESGTNGNQVDDASGRVLATLGVYPDAAIAWLSADKDDFATDGTLGDARLTYWFGQRDWSVGTSGDGFEGVHALWAGLQRAEGGLVAGAADGSPLDVAVMQDVASLSTSVFELLSRNAALEPENVSTHGAMLLATALVQQLEQLGEYPISARSPNTGVVVTGILGGEPVPIVNAKQDWVADLFGVAGHDLAGREVLAAHVAEYQEHVTSLATVPGSMLTAEGAILRLLGTQAALEGAPVGAGLAVGRRDDDALKAGISAAGGFVGAVSVPGKYLGSWAFGQLVGSAGDLVGTHWATAYNDALQLEYGNEEERNVIMREKLGLLVEDYVALGLMDPDPRFVDEQIADYNDGFDAWAREGERQ